MPYSHECNYFSKQMLFLAFHPHLNVMEKITSERLIPGWRLSKIHFLHLHLDRKNYDFLISNMSFISFKNAFLCMDVNFK